MAAPPSFSPSAYNRTNLCCAGDGRTTKASLAINEKKSAKRIVNLENMVAFVSFALLNL
jgi:hypothetical protein